MGNNIASIPRPPSTTLSIDSTVYQGQNQIRRNIGTFTSLYIGDNVVSRVLAITPFQKVIIAENITAIWIKTNTPLIAKLVANTSWEFTLNQTLAIDTPLKELSLYNPTDYMASVNLDYLVTV